MPSHEQKTVFIESQAIWQKRVSLDQTFHLLLYILLPQVKNILKHTYNCFPPFCFQGMVVVVMKLLPHASTPFHFDNVYSSTHAGHAICIVYTTAVGVQINTAKFFMLLGRSEAKPQGSMFSAVTKPPSAT